jgi:hypothetical protein
MRFSLATLVLLVLWIGSLMLIWERRETWIIDIEAPKTGEYISSTTSDGRRVHFGFHELTILNDRTVLWSKTIFKTLAFSFIELNSSITTRLPLIMVNMANRVCLDGHTGASPNGGGAIFIGRKFGWR